MLIPKIEITNPQAIELIKKIQSRQIYVPIVAWFKKNKWSVISSLVLVVLIAALAIGKKLSERTPVPTFTPPDIESLVPTGKTTIKSDFSGLKEEIQNLNTDVQDPFIPVFDNVITLEEATL